MALAREIKGFTTRLSPTRLADRLFTPHGLAAYLEVLVPGGTARVEAPDRAPNGSPRSGRAVHRTVLPAAGADPVDDLVEPPTAAPPSSAPSAPAVVAGEASVTFESSGLEIRAAEGDTTLLVLAEENGLTPKYRCRRGICGTCTTTKTSGVVRDLRTGDLSEPDETPIRICVSVPCGDVSLAL